MKKRNFRINFCAMMLVVIAVISCGCSSASPVTIDRAATVAIDSTNRPSPSLTPEQTQAPTTAPSSPTPDKTSSPTPSRTPDSTPSPSKTPEVTPSPTPTDPPKTATSGDPYVWISLNGDKYHIINNCGNMNPDTATKLLRSQAVDSGYDACANCSNTGSKVTAKPTAIPTIAPTIAVITATPEPTDTSADVLVWKSATGSKYHSQNNCGNMNPAKAVQITLERAKSQGLEPCKNCDPPH